MMMIKQIVLAFIVVTSLILTTGCSTLPVSDHQTVAQNSTPMLASVDGRAGLPQAMAGASRVEFEVADAGRGSSSRLVAWVFEPSENLAQRGAVVALHGCGGLYDRKGDLSIRHRRGAERLVQQGFVVLLPDSFGSRGLREICTLREGERTVGIAQRRLDALAALYHLARRPDIDASRVAVLGWSNGASTVLASIALQGARRDHDARPSGFARAIAFYPGCGAALRQGLKPTAPVLLLLGAEDDWTPPQPCLQWAARFARSAGAPIEVELYPGAHHGFDGPGSRPMRRTDVPRAPDGKGVTVGGQPAARERSWKRVEQWLAPLQEPGT